jgi:hypothetical protein
LKTSGVCTDSKFYFRNWFYLFLNPSICSHFQVARSLLSLAVFRTISSSIRTKLQAASMTESNELERIQTKFAAPWYSRFFPQFIISVCRSYTNAFDYLKLCTLPESRRHLKALLLLIFTFVPNFILRLWILLFFCFVLEIWKNFMCFIWTHNNFPSVGSKSVPDVVCGDVDTHTHTHIYIYRKKVVSVDFSLYIYWLKCLSGLKNVYRYVYFILIKVWVVIYRNCDALGFVFLCFSLFLFIFYLVFLLLFMCYFLCVCGDFVIGHQAVVLARKWTKHLRYEISY